MKKNSRGLGFYLMMIAVVILAFIVLKIGFTPRNNYTYQQFNDAVKSGNVDKVDIHPNQQVPTGRIIIYMKDGSYQDLNVTDIKEVEEILGTAEIPFYVFDMERDSVFWTSVFPILMLGIVVVLLVIFMNRQSGGGGSNNRMMNFGKSHAKIMMPDSRKITFKEVAGLQEEKEDLEEIVDFLKTPKKYLEVGARIPKGVLLVGPPGTGKTLLAKAVAGEAGVPFFSISGSDFVEMFVGVGASRVRDLFSEAKKNAPCIIFIDEIDAVARRRGTGLGGGHDEREQTLNQLLVEMDGFGANEGIIVMAATNRVDILDPAILRPGRFDRKVGVGKPEKADVKFWKYMQRENLLEMMLT